MSGKSYGIAVDVAAVSEVAEHSATLVGNKIYVFGGNDFRGNRRYGFPSSKLQVLDYQLNARSEPRTTRPWPTQRKGHASCLANDKLFVLGGASNLRDNGDSEPDWYFDVVLEEWIRLSTGLQVLANVSGMSADFLDGRGEIAVFGGARFGFVSNELYVLNVESCRLSKALATGTPPTPRSGHMSASTGKAIYICGGSLGEMDLFILTPFGSSGLQWSMVKRVLKPMPRSLGSFVRVDDRLVLYGGKLSSGEKCDEVWEMCLRTRRWVLLERAKEWYVGSRLIPSAVRNKRFGHTATVVGKGILILGGYPSNTTHMTIVLDPRVR